MSSGELQSELVAANASLAAHDIRLQVTPEWRDALLGPNGLRWDEWQKAGLIHLVKQGAHRTVYRVDLPGHAFYLKHYHPQGWSATAANWIRGSAARREWRNSLELRRRGLSTAEPIALGETRGRRESLFVSQAIANARTIEEFDAMRCAALEEVDHALARHKVMVALAQLCAATHRAGVEHADFHGGNVLVELDTACMSKRETNSPRLYWIDLPKMRFSAPLNWRRSCASLAILAAGWLHRTTRSERQRFWNAYLAACPDLALLERGQAADEILAMARTHARKTLAGRDKRALATNRDFYRWTDADFTAHAVRDVAPTDLVSCVREPHPADVPSAVWKILDQMVGVGLPAKLIVGGASQNVSIRIVGSRKGWWRIAGPPPAIQQWRLANAILARRIHTPRPLCAVQPSDRRRSGYLVTEGIDATSLCLLIPGSEERPSCNHPQAPEGFPPLPSREGRGEGGASPDLLPSARGAVAIAVGKLLGELHCWNFTLPRDGVFAIEIGGHNPRNASETPIAWLVRFDGVELLEVLPSQRRTLDLTRCLESLILHRVSRADRLRCLFAYLRSANLANDNWKALWRSIDSRSGFSDIAKFRAERVAKLAAESAAGDAHLVAENR